MADFELTVLGSASGLPEVGRSHASVAVSRGNSIWLLDAGEGVSSALLRWGLDPQKVRGIYVTHLHPDHCVGVFMMLQYLHVCQFSGQIDIYIPAGAIEVFQRFADQLYLVKGHISPAYSLKPLGREHRLGDDLTLETFPTTHLQSWETSAISGLETRAYAFRVRSPLGSCFYSGDVGRVDDLADHLRGDDLFILEAAHVDLEAVFGLVQRVGIERIIFTHALPEQREVIETLSRSWAEAGLSVDLAYDGLKLTV